MYVRTGVAQLQSAGFIFNKADLDWERHFRAFVRLREQLGRTQHQKTGPCLVQKVHYE